TRFCTSRRAYLVLGDWSGSRSYFLPPHWRQHGRALIPARVLARVLVLKLRHRRPKAPTSGWLRPLSSISGFDEGLCRVEIGHIQYGNLTLQLPPPKPLWNGRRDAISIRRTRHRPSATRPPRVAPSLPEKSCHQGALYLIRCDVVHCSPSFSCASSVRTRRRS